MAEKKISVAVKPTIKKLGKGYELCVIAMKPKGNNVDWVATVKDKDGHSVATFNKPLGRDMYTSVIQGVTLPINDNGVQATYQEWKAEVEDTFKIKIPWQPTGRKMFRLDL